MKNRPRRIIFRVDEEEYQKIKALKEASCARSMSDFYREKIFGSEKEKLLKEIITLIEGENKKYADLESRVTHLETFTRLIG